MVQKSERTEEIKEKEPKQLEEELKTKDEDILMS